MSALKHNGGRQRYLSWPGVQARESLAMFRYNATDVLASVQVPALVFTDRLELERICGQCSDPIGRR